MAILKETLNLQMKNVIFQKARNWKQHASLFQYSCVEIESYGTAFQKKLICTVQCFERPNNIHFLTETENIISDTIWHFFCKKSKLSILKYFEKVFIKDSNLFILLLKTSFRFKRRLKFLFGNVEYLHVKLSQRLLFQSKSFL